MFPKSRTRASARRRGAVGVLVAVFLVALLGFAALSVDVGVMYNARTEIQRTADSAALGAASRLADYSTGDPLALATATAVELATRNEVFRQGMQLDAGDIVFGRGNYDPNAHTFQFVQTNDDPDAVRVRVRMTGNSSNGPLGLFFARIFGHASTDVSAEATAVMVPRDIALVADMSASHSDDSELRHYDVTDINLFDVWDDLPGGIYEAVSTWNPATIPPSWINADGTVPQAAGPGWGYMKTMGYGDMTVPSTFNPLTDPGLVKLTYRQSWSNAQLSNYLSAQGYNAAEVSAIMTNGGADTSTIYPYRVSVALGLATWNSGMAGGRWSLVGAPAGNGNTTMAGSELQWAESMMGRSLAASGAIWTEYVNYMKSTSTWMYDASSSFRYEFGIKTFTNFLLEQRGTFAETPELNDTRHQPMQAVKDATNHLMGYLNEIDSNDMVSLEIYGTTANHEVDLTSNFSQVADRLDDMQAGHYDGYTNTGGGIEQAITQLTGPLARTSAKKVMILLTDGKANVSASGAVGTNAAAEAAGAAYALSAAQQAADQGIKIFAVSVGAEANIALMEQIADIGGGEHFYAYGSIDQYSAALEQIFETIGGRRPVALVE